MSDNDKVASAGAAPTFSERELQLLGWAMQSLKSGPPEIDYDKLAAFANMSNPRSASNAWAKIKTKLMTPEGAAVPVTPKNAAGGKKKAAAANGEDGEDTPKKATPVRKRSAKKQDVDGEASPKKKGRGKKASDEEAEIKAESDETSALTPNSDAPVKAEPSEELNEEEV